jgi:hypothetical protein
MVDGGLSPLDSERPLFASVTLFNDSFEWDGADARSNLRPRRTFFRRRVVGDFFAVIERDLTETAFLRAEWARV